MCHKIGKNKKSDTLQSLCMRKGERIFLLLHCTIFKDLYDSCKLVMDMCHLKIQFSGWKHGMATTLFFCVTKEGQYRIMLKVNLQFMKHIVLQEI